MAQDGTLKMQWCNGGMTGIVKGPGNVCCYCSLTRSTAGLLFLWLNKQSGNIRFTQPFIVHLGFLERDSVGAKRVHIQ